MSFLLHDPLLRPLDDNGAVMAGCYFKFFDSGTATPTPVYADADLATELTDPITADSAGKFVAIYGDTSVVYRRQLYNADDELLDDTDPIHPHVQFPAGTIVFFRGDATARDAAYPTSLWQVCDGTNGTTDNRGKLIIGANGSSYVAGTAYGAAPGALTSSESGSVAEGTTGSTALTEAQGAVHRHKMFVNATGTGAVTSTTQIYVNSNSGGDTEYSLDGTDGTDATVGETAASAGGDGHTHTVPAIAAHTHTVTTTLPPCVAYWMLERKA